MLSYVGAVRALQPVIVPIYEALEYGLEVATREHGRLKYVRDTDPWFYLHSVRRAAIENLRSKSLAAMTDDGSRSMLALSGMVIPYKGVAVRVIRPEVGKDRKGKVRSERIPIPGRSKARQRFWRQEPLPGMESIDNLLLVWTDSDGVLTDPMILARPVGGSHRRGSLLLSWDGRLSREMASLRVADLDELRPDNVYEQLGDEAG